MLELTSHDGTFTFMHFADAIIQSDLQYIQVIHFVTMCVPWKLYPQPFVLLTQCSTTEPQEHYGKYLLVCSSIQSCEAVITKAGVFY